MTPAEPTRETPPRAPKATAPRALLALVAAAAAACAGEPVAATDSAAVDADTSADTSTGCGLPGSSYAKGEATSSEDLQVAVQLLDGAITVKGKLVIPGNCNKITPCPLVVVVGDRGSSPLPQWSVGAERLSTSTGAVVALFNLPGTGIGGHKSGGEDDFGGDTHLAAVKEVMRLVSERNFVDKKRSGYLTVGWGLVPTAAALKKFSLSSLAFVDFLIDVEGPSDRCAASQAPADPSLSIGPDDGPGASESACNFSATNSHAAAYPVGNAGKPASIVCAPGAWPITETGKGCNDDSWWTAREPARQLGSSAIDVRYQRVAFHHDHRMPSQHATRVLVSALAASKSRFFTVNDMPPCATPLSDAACADLAAQCQRCWLEGSWGNGMAPAPYADDLAEITTDELLGDVLPRFVRRLLDPAASPNCR